MVEGKEIVTEEETRDYCSHWISVMAILKHLRHSENPDIINELGILEAPVTF